jgi:hypothetical protein
VAASAKLHAEIYRKLLSLAKQGNIPWSADFITSIKNDYPGLTDYYTRYEYNVWTTTHKYATVDGTTF